MSIKKWSLNLSRRINNSLSAPRLKHFRRSRAKNKLRLELLEDRRVMAFNPLAIDINTTPNSSTTSQIVEVNGVGYFAATSPLHGNELWRTDGTTAGTWMVKDLQPGTTGSYPSQFVNANGKLFFRATDELTGQVELFTSDGTAAGTLPVNSSAGSVSPDNIISVGGTVYFTGSRQTEPTWNRELWKSDGTAAGTVLVRDIVRGTASSYPQNLTNVNGTLFFTASTATSGRELWKSNGTAATTVLVREIAVAVDSSYPNDLTNVNGTLFFTANNVTNGRELWKSDGTTAGTTMVKDIVAGSTSSYPTNLTAVGSTLFLETGNELWKSNGTSAGTVAVEAAGTGSGYIGSMFNAGGTLFFSAWDPTFSYELWKSDGTAAGTVLVKDINPVGSSMPSRFTVVGSTLFFRALGDSSTNYELFKSDGTSSGTVLVKDLDNTPYASGTPENLVNINGKLVFDATEPQHGRELWVSDGTTSGTTLLKDVDPRTANDYPDGLVALGSTLYFNAYNPTIGNELWKSDGTVAGTRIVLDTPVGLNPQNLTVVGSTLYFTSGGELWKSNGTSAGTVPVEAASTGSYSVSDLRNVNGTLYFTAQDGVNGRELWKSNGTAAGTVLVKDIVAGATSSYVQNMVNAGSVLYFTADDGSNGRELWKSDGTSGGTVLVKDIYPGASNSNPTELVVQGSTLYFVAYDSTNGVELWKSNGTGAGTTIVKDTIAGAAGSYPTGLTVVGTTLFFSANEGLGVVELFKSNGTSGGTIPVEGTDGITNLPTNLTEMGGLLYFTAIDEAGSAGFELFKTDGTAAGTTLVADTVPGPAGPTNVNQMRNINGTLFYVATTPGSEAELWQSGGSAATTRQTTTIMPGSQPPYIANLTNLNGKLAFVATDPVVGRSLKILGPNTAPVVNVPSPVAIAEDSSGFVTGVSVSDPDIADSPMRVTLNATNGVVTLSTTVPGGLTSANVLNNGTGLVTINGTISTINATLANATGLSFTPNANYAGSAIITVTANDLGNVGFGNALSTSVPLTINVTPVNDAPVLSLTSSINYTENAAATIVAPAATLADIDSANFNGGSIIVAPGSTDTNDRLGVRNEGTGAGQIGVSGTTVTFAGTTIGTIASGLSGGNLQVNLNASATVAAVQALIRNVTYRNISENPVAGARNLVFTATDNASGVSAPATATVTVAAVNDAPTLTFPGATVTYTENAALLALDAGATSSDAEGNYDLGTLTTTITVNGTADDRLEVINQGLAAGQISVSGSFISFGTATVPVVIGSLTGGVGTTPLVVTFNAAATPAAVQALARAIGFRTLTESPSTANRTVTMRVADGNSALSSIATRTVQVTSVNDTPVISTPGPNPVYTEDSVMVISSTIALTDVDSANFDTGVLTVAVTLNSSTADQLSVRNQGTGAGQIGLSGTTVTFGGTTIGTLAGGGGSTPMTVTLNANATPAAVQALMRNVTFTVTSQNPSTLARRVNFVVTDGDGGTSNSYLYSVSVVRVNDAPVLSSISGSVVYSQGSAATILASTAGLADADSSNYDAGNLTVAITANSAAGDIIGINNQGFGAGQIGTFNGNVFYAGVAIGTFTGGTGATPLVVSFNSAAKLTETRALMRQITFQSTGTPPTAVRTITFTVNDGDGATSAPLSKTASINLAPVMTLPGAIPNYVEAGPAVVIDNAATLTDSDSANFAGGVLTIAVTNNVSASDRLAIINEGTGAGQIGVSGANITFAGTVIGTFTGGAGGTALTITFNTNALVSRIQTLLRKITFSVDGAGISKLTRTVAFTISDGDGATSATVSKNITVS